jgi:hypothetical protein
VVLALGVGGLLALGAVGAAVGGAAQQATGAALRLALLVLLAAALGVLIPFLAVESTRNPNFWSRPHWAYCLRCGEPASTVLPEDWLCGACRVREYARRHAGARRGPPDDAHS